jgi:endoglucanase
MQNATILPTRKTVFALALFAIAVALTGCAADQGAGAGSTGKSAFQPIRINAGATTTNTDAQGRTWLADTGFTGGNVIDRGALAIANTNIPAVYRTEHYGMTSFTQAVPNGDYTVVLHFAETFDGVTAKGERVFGVDVNGKKLDNLDVFAEAGGLNKALVKTLPVTVTDGKITIKFLANVQNPEINGIEILAR